MKVYLHLNGEEFEKAKKKANEHSKEDDETSKNYNFDWMNLESSEVNFDSGVLSVGGSNELGYFNMDIELDMDTVIDIIEFYMKKLGKLKTILEATK